MSQPNDRMIEATSAELEKDWQEYQHLRYAHPELFGLFSTGLRSLDSRLGGDEAGYGGGIERGQYVLIAGKPKSGKSTLLLNMAIAAAKQNLKFIWFGAEMTNMQIGSMLFSNLSGISRTKIRRMGLEHNDWDVIEKAGGQIETWGGYWVQGFSTVQDVIETVDKIKLQGIHLDLIFGDYVQLMEGENYHSSNRTEELATISRRLKRVATDGSYPIATIFASQKKRTSYDTDADAASYLGSGAFERDMDIGIDIGEIKDPSEPKNVIPNKRMLSIVASRETVFSTGFEVYYNGATATFSDWLPETNLDMQNRFK